MSYQVNIPDMGRCSMHMSLQKYEREEELWFSAKDRSNKTKLRNTPLNGFHKKDRAYEIPRAQR